MGPLSASVQERGVGFLPGSWGVLGIGSRQGHGLPALSRVGCGYPFEILMRVGRGYWISVQSRTSGGWAPFREQFD